MLTLYGNKSGAERVNNKRDLFWTTAAKRLYDFSNIVNQWRSIYNKETIYPISLAKKLMCPIILHLHYN